MIWYEYDYFITTRAGYAFLSELRGKNLLPRISYGVPLTNISKNDINAILKLFFC